MATRFYMPSSGVSPLDSLAAGTWGQSSITRLPAVRTKSNTELTTRTLQWPTTESASWAWYQFVSETLDVAQTITTADTISMVVGKMAETTTGGDTHLAFVLRVVSQDGLTVRGTLLSFQTTATELALIANERQEYTMQDHVPQMLIVNQVIVL